MGRGLRRGRRARPEIYQEIKPLKKSTPVINILAPFFPGRLSGILASGCGRTPFPGPGFLPFIAGLLLGILAIMAFVQTLKEKASKERGFLSFGDYLVKVGILIGALVVYVFLLDILGFLMGTFLLLLFLFRIVEPLRWRTVFLASLITLGAVYLLFDCIFGYPVAQRNCGVVRIRRLSVINLWMFLINSSWVFRWPFSRSTCFIVFWAA